MLSCPCCAPIESSRIRCARSRVYCRYCSEFPLDTSLDHAFHPRRPNLPEDATSPWSSVGSSRLGMASRSLGYRFNHWSSSSEDVNLVHIRRRYMEHQDRSLDGYELEALLELDPMGFHAFPKLVHYHKSFESFHHKFQLAKGSRLFLPWN